MKNNKLFITNTYFFNKKDIKNFKELSNIEKTTEINKLICFDKLENYNLIISKELKNIGVDEINNEKIKEYYKDNIEYKVAENSFEIITKINNSEINNIKEIIKKDKKEMEDFLNSDLFKESFENIKNKSNNIL